MTGTGSYTIQDGQLGAANAELDLSVLGSGVLTVTSTLGGGSANLVKGGTGSLYLTAANAYSGGTVLSGGLLNINADAALAPPAAR